MILRFPDLDALSLAITAGVISPEVVLAPAEIGTDAADTPAWWVRCEESLKPDQLAELQSLGIVADPQPPRPALRPVCCWLEAFPLEPVGPQQIVVDAQTPVLFEMSDAALLPDLAGEILRLGNDRQGFRIFWGDPQPSALLRVVGSPYYSLLRAIGEGQGTGGSRPAGGVRAYIEAASRVWIEVGVRHPFAEKIRPAAGEHLLIDRTGRWRTLAEQPFRDIYEAMSFELPAQPTSLTDCDHTPRITVPLRLLRGGGDEPAELWVLHHNAAAQVEKFVQSSSDDVLARLAFAVVGEASDPTIVVRLRPGRTTPPVLVFEGLACRCYLRIPNLFLPVGQRVHPPLRRDVVKQMLAADEHRIVWLEPGEEGRFVPRSIDDGSLRPLTDWVDYVLDQHHEELDAWRQSHRFDFDNFICPDDKPKPPRTQRQTTPNSPDTTPKAPAAPPVAPPKEGFVERITRRIRPGGRERSGPAKPAQVTRLEQQLATLEAEFLAHDAPLDAPERLSQWARMADLNEQLERLTDASLCRLHALWETASPDEPALAAWFDVELQAARRGGASELIDEATGDVSELTLSRLLSVKSPTPAEVSQLAAYLTYARATGQTAPIERQLSRVSRYLQQHETMLAVRSQWLAWSAIAHLSGGDVLALARARDRLLERLHQHGLSPEVELPAFLRTQGGSAGQRFRIVRERVVRLHDKIWEFAIRNTKATAKPETKTLSYIDLMFAYAAARLGESTRCRRLVEDARKDLLDHPDAVHGWLYRAFEFRISQALQGEPLAGPLPVSHVRKLKDIERTERYKIDRLREHSTILDPHEALDPYREWKKYHIEAFDQRLNELFDINDRDRLLEAVKKLFAQKQPIAERARLVTAALELSPRLGEKFGLKILQHVIPTDRKLSDPVARAALLENGLEIAAHFDQRDLVPQFLDRLHGLLQHQEDADVKTLAALETVLMQSFRGLRRLGMRNELARLLDEFARSVRPENNESTIEPERLRVLLRMAGGWFYFGQDRGWDDIDLARDVLLEGTLLAEGHVGAMKQTQLAVAYVQAVGEAPLEAAFARWEELFAHLDGIHDANVVNTHYSLKILDIVEALVLTMVSEGFQTDKASQRWLDEEEYLIRKRIHADVRRVT
jgi:cellulose synthase operon protein C